MPSRVREIAPVSGSAAFRLSVIELAGGFPQAATLALRFFQRDLRAEHRQSLLGYLWIAIPVVGQTLIWLFLNDQDIVKIDSGATPYALFVVSGTILWSAFNGGVMAVLGVVNQAKGVLAKVNFPQESLIYAACLKSAMEAGIASLLVVPVALVVDFKPGLGLLLFPAAVLAALLVGWAAATLMLPLAALYGDVSRVIQLVLRFGFFVTPVVYPLPTSEPVRTAMLLNPVASVVLTGRAWLTGQAAEAAGLFWLTAIGSSVVLAIGLIVYRIALPHLIERLSA